MRHLLFTVATLFAIVSVIASCSSTETYAEMRQKEIDAIKDFISRHNITVLDVTDFNNKGYVTDTSKNEYVLLKATGVYLQIIDKGTDGSILADGANATLLSRYIECNINGTKTNGTCVMGLKTCTKDSIQTSNMDFGYATLPDIYSVLNTSGTYTASFSDGVMYRYYGSTSVPGGWLVPLKYVNLGRGSSKPLKTVDGRDSVDAKGNLVPGRDAHVRIIVPHDQGSETASSNVIAMWYDLYYKLANSQ